MDMMEAKIKTTLHMHVILQTLGAGTHDDGHGYNIKSMGNAIDFQQNLAGTTGVRTFVRLIKNPSGSLQQRLPPRL
jgi:hypothetical protein